MKTLKKSLLTAIACTTLLSLSSCGQTALDMNKWTFKPANESNVKIGILQPVEHEALSNTRLGFIEGLKENGYEDGKNISITYQNANGEASSLNTLAKSLTSSCDLTFGVATGATVALQSAQINSGSTKPILFSAVTDAVSAGLVKSNEKPEAYITGTSDMNPVVDQINLIKECIPTVDKIGILYTQSEVNSEVQADAAEEEAKAKGIEVIRKTCTDTSDLSSVVNNLCAISGIDAIYIPTDNVIASNMPTVKAALDEHHILCVTGEENMMKVGGHITLSVSYFDIGKKAGEMAAKIIKKEAKPNELPVYSMKGSECTYVMSSENLAASGVTIPDTVIAKCTDASSK